MKFSFFKIVHIFLVVASMTIINAVSATENLVFMDDIQNEKTYSIDINKDGLEDFISFSFLNKSVLPFIQQLDGHFVKGQLSYLYQHPNVAIENIYPGQFDNDGILDLIIVYSSQFVSFYKGFDKGKFTFHSEYEIPFGNFLRSTSGDLDSDGKLEIIVAPDSFASNRLSFFIFSNIKDNYNQFPFSTKYQLLHFNNVLKKSSDSSKLDSLDQITIGNFNNDHLKDIALLDKTFNRVLTLTTNIREKYIPSDILTIPYQVHSMFIIDIDNDGIDDLITTPEENRESKYSHIYLTNDNKFNLFQKLLTGSKVTDIKVGHFLNNWEKHFVFSSQTMNQISLYSLATNHKLSSKPVLGLHVPSVPGKLNCSDMNNDGLDDIIVTGPNDERANITLFKNISLN